MSSRVATTNLPVSHPVRSLHGLAKQIALPHEYSPLRFPSFPALERTALMGFSVPATLSLPASTAVKIMACRQAAYPVWADQTLFGTTYQVGWCSDNVQTGTTTTQATFPITSGPFNAFSGVTAASNAVVGVTSPNATSLPYPPMGIDATSGSSPFIYVSGSAYVYAVVVAQYGTFGTSTTAEINFQAWTSPGEIVTYGGLDVTITSGNTGGSASIPTTVRGTGNVWLRPSLVSFSNTAGTLPERVCVYIVISHGGGTYAPGTTDFGTFTFSPGDLTGFYPLSTPTEFGVSKLPWYATRTTAASFLGTNVSQVLNKGGTVLAGRISPCVQNAFTVTSTYVSQLHPAEKAYLPLETGVYTYVPPSTDMASFWDYTTATRGDFASSAPTVPIVSWPVFRLDNDSMYHVMFLTASAVAESLACTIDWHLEFRTSSALFQIGMSTMTLETLHQAQIALAEVGYFFDNVDHKAILNAIIGAVKKHGPALASMVGGLGPVGSTAVRLGQMLLSSKPRPTPQTTSAQASGMVKVRGIRPKRVKVKLAKKKKSKK